MAGGEEQQARGREGGTKRRSQTAQRKARRKQSENFKA